MQAGPASAAAQGAGEAVPADRRFPVAVVLAHGLFAVATPLLVLLTALGLDGG